MDSHPSELAGSLGSKNRYFDFHSLAKVRQMLTPSYLLPLTLKSDSQRIFLM